MIEGWKEYKLEDLAPYITEKINSSKLNSQNYISADNMLPDRNGIVSSDYLPTNGKVTKFEINDILVSNIRPYFKKIWYAKYNGGCSNDVIVFRGNKDLINSTFLYYYLSKDDFFDFMMAGANGTKMPRGNKKAIPKYKIHLPPLPTQRKIAKILSAYDDLIENNLKRIKLLEEMAQKTYEEWFVRFKFPGNETAKFNKETGLPEGWEYEKVGNLLSKIKSTTKIKTHEILEKGEIPVIDQSRDFIKGYTNNTNSILNYPEPLIVFGDHTRILKFINFPFARGADGTQILLSKDDAMPQHLFYHSLLNIDLSNYHYARHFKFLKDEEIIIPKKRIAFKYEDKTKTQFELIKNLRNQNQRLKEARDILLPRLMTGVINV